MSGLGYAAMSAITLAVILMVTGAAVAECQLIAWVGAALAILEASEQTRRAREREQREARDLAR